MAVASNLTNPSLHGAATDSPAAAPFHHDRSLRLSRSVRTWQQVAGGRLLTTLGLTGGLVYVTSQQQSVPSIVAVDEGGSATIKKLQPRTVLDPLVITAQRKHWLTEFRTCSTNDALVRRQMHAASQHCLAPVQQLRTRSSTENTSPETLKRGRARWKEQLGGPNGTVAEETAWEATLEIALVQPQSQEERQHRPRGLWIASLHRAHL